MKKSIIKFLASDKFTTFFVVFGVIQLIAAIILVIINPDIKSSPIFHTLLSVLAISILGSVIVGFVSFGSIAIVESEDRYETNKK